MTRVGFIGLGAMGLPMAAHLSAKGFDVAAFDLRAASVDAAAEAGARRAQSAADAARGAGILVLMVVNAAQAAAVLFDGGALDALDADGTVILMATCAPRRSKPSTPGSPPRAAISSMHPSRAASSARRPGRSRSWRRPPQRRSRP
jgi:3-hydroxyisobutyrate dehydrogenase-like beta-hydroxyacid dehydrogenase